MHMLWVCLFVICCFVRFIMFARWLRILDAYMYVNSGPDLVYATNCSLPAITDREGDKICLFGS
jgi:hypothetical protein